MKTTTDALAVDWFYCDAQTFEISKKSVQFCKSEDRIGFKKCWNRLHHNFEIFILIYHTVKTYTTSWKRPIFSNRVCDGFVDCLDESDEGMV